MDLLAYASSRRAKLKSLLYFFGTAAVAGILCNLLVFHLYSPIHAPVLSAGIHQKHGSQCSDASSLSSYKNPLQWELLPELSVNEIEDMVSKTNGFYVRDWSLGLGWNNIRYILEAALLHAQLLNRTLVIPSFVYARACEYDIDTCASYARMVNRNDAVGSDEWRELPIEEQMAWRLPIEVMIDIAHLRSVHPIIFVSDYLRLRGVDIRNELSNGHWSMDEYHAKGVFVSNFTIENQTYDPKDTVRVDDYSPAPHEEEMSTVGQQAHEILQRHSKLLKQPCLALPLARGVISGVANVSDTETLYSVIKDAGWVPLHTWEGALSMDFVKWVVRPRVDVAHKDTIRGLIQEWGHRTEEVLYLQGEIHLGRKPGSLRFMTKERARKFASLILHDMHAVRPVQELAERIMHRMDSLVGGRLWMAAHMRRGDFVRHNWVMEPSIKAHLRRIRGKLQIGRDKLRYLHNIPHKTYDVPDPHPNQLAHRREAPYIDDPFYLATDERDPTKMDFLRNNSAILFEDIFSIRDRREIGWPLLFTDVAALVEQTVMGRGAGFFYGHGLSSVVGGVVNIRAAAGWDPDTALID